MNITEKIQELKQNRIVLIEKLSHLNTQQFNEIPLEYTNNIIWNLGHMLVTPIYHLYSGAEKMPPNIHNLYKKYLKDTKPNTRTGSLEIEEILNLMIPTLERLEEDFHAGVFSHDQGFALSAFERGFDFLIFHENIHINTIMGILKAMGSGR